MKELFIQMVKDRAFEYAVIPVSLINFSHEVIEACKKNTCGNYDKRWTCPPACGSIEQHRKYFSAYSSAFIFTTKADLKDSFDYEGMMDAKKNHNSIASELHSQFGKTNPVYGAGACEICKTCSYPKPCKFPDKKFISVEAAGINVTELSKAAGLHYYNGENTVTYFSVILF